MKTTLGGDRLGSGQKEEISFHNYERSTHDLGYVWRSSMAPGTLVPFMSQVALPGDSWDIDLNCEVMTLPTIGPLFGSYKVQLDIFEVPIRLYQGKLHMNMLGIGLDMSSVLLPQLEVKAKSTKITEVEGVEQINPSCILSYLNMRGLGISPLVSEDVKRYFNAVPFLAYWDIFKCYYSNKQEENAYVITNDMNEPHATITHFFITTTESGINTTDIVTNDMHGVNLSYTLTGEIYVTLPNNYIGTDFEFNLDSLYMTTNPGSSKPVSEYWNNSKVILPIPIGQPNRRKIVLTGWRHENILTDILHLATDKIYFVGGINNSPPTLKDFPLENIDKMRLDILTAVQDTGAFTIDANSIAPYNYVLSSSETNQYRCTANQEGLAVKTYQSDLFNNWIQTEWIDGENGINAITSVDTTGGSFTIDSLNLANKVYTMLNRVAISGGSYDDWLNAVYTHERSRGAENPIYQGSLIKELAFEEVISNSTSETSVGGNQPLGTLAGRGRMTQKNKGGRVRLKINEPSYIMGIVSLTPRIDYSQGNQWDTNLKTMNDFHKPALDAIGFQDLITDQMAWFGTYVAADGTTTYQSAGKQPAWINYMTNVNVCRGHFAEELKGMFMTLNRRYEPVDVGTGIKDITTYIDPVKYNQIFADTSLDAQNFWVQIACNITARRKMSAKVIPNL